MAAGEHPKSTLTAWERWELASFDAPIAPVAAPANSPPPPPVSAEEVEQIREQARLAGHQAGYAAGLAAGEAAGHAAGLAAGQAEAEAMGREEALILAQALEKFERDVEELNQIVADELLALSLEVARQVIRQVVAAKPEVLLGVIREALGQLPLQHAAIHVNPEDASLLRLRAGDQLTHAGHRIHEDPKLKRGDVVIEAGGSHIDASLASRWRRVVEGLGQNTPWIDSGQNEAAAEVRAIPGGVQG